MYTDVFTYFDFVLSSSNLQGMMYFQRISNHKVCRSHYSKALFGLPRGLSIAPRVVVALGQQGMHVLTEAG